LGDCRIYRAPPSSTSKPGTPAGRQEERAVKANFPASTWSLSFFITSFAHCFRLGLLMSPMRWVGCCPVMRDSSFEMYLWAGSCPIGFGEPGTGRGAPMPIPRQAVWTVGEKTGSALAAIACSTAAIPAADAKTRNHRTLLLV